jgi:tRNA 2-thiouridine synthesizing protein A
MQHKKIDITKDNCPVTFVKVKLALEQLNSGDILEVRLNAGEAVNNVPRSLHNEGHIIVSLTGLEDGSYILLVRKI